MDKNSNKQLRFLRLAEVLARTGLSRSSLYAQVSEGRFPEPVGISERSVAWIEGDIEQWMLDRIARARSRASHG